MSTANARKRLVGIQSKLGLTRKCPEGQILRAPYKRKFSNTVRQRGYNIHRNGKTVRVYPKATSVLVKATCIQNKGLPGKGPNLIGPLKDGELTKYGYRAQLNRESRHAALKKAVEVYGPLSTYRKLDAVAKLTLRTAPDAHKVFKADREWIRTHYLKKREA